MRPLIGSVTFWGSFMLVHIGQKGQWQICIHDKMQRTVCNKFSAFYSKHFFGSFNHKNYWKKCGQNLFIFNTFLCTVHLNGWNRKMDNYFDHTRMLRHLVSEKNFKYVNYFVSMQSYMKYDRNSNEIFYIFRSHPFT